MFALCIGGLLLGLEVRGQAGIPQLWSTMWVMGSYADVFAASLEAIGPDSDDADVVKMAWLQSGHCYGCFLVCWGLAHFFAIQLLELDRPHEFVLKRAHPMCSSSHRKGLLTDYTVDPYEELLHRPARMWPCPVHGGLVNTDVGEHDIGGVWDIDAEDVDQFGHGLPQCLNRPA